jgi:hypothetical protein
MNIQKVDNWLNAIIYEDGHKMSVGSLRTLELIRKECCISQAPKEPETVHGNEAEKEVCTGCGNEMEETSIWCCRKCHPMMF